MTFDGSYAEEAECQGAPATNSVGVLLGKYLQSLYEFSDGELVPAHEQKVFPTSQVPHDLPVNQPYLLSDGHRYVPIAWPPISLNQNGPSTPKINAEQQYSVKDGSVINTMVCNYRCTLLGQAY